MQKLGLKHRCLHCNALFYDLGNENPTCPACDKPHSIEDAIKLKPFQSEDKPTSAKEDDDTTLETEEEEDVVVLDNDDDDDDPTTVTEIKPTEDKEDE